jgi:ribosomal protein L5
MGVGDASGSEAARGARERAAADQPAEALDSRAKKSISNFKLREASPIGCR